VASVHRIAAGAAWSLCALAAVAQNVAPRIASIDVYGSRTFDSAKLRAEFEPELLRYAALGIEAQTNSNADMQRLEAEAVAIQEKVKAALSAAGPLAYFDVSTTTDFGPPPQVHVMVDVVEQADAAQRMPFRVAPTSEVADPDGLRHSI
jgi:hypothetical protein